MYFSAVYRLQYVDISWRSAARGVKQGSGGENKLFSSYMRQYLENSMRYVQSYY